MDSGGPGDPVTLVIKAPNQNYEDQTIHCSLHWTVGRLKSHIALVYPSRPVRRCSFTPLCQGLSVELHTPGIFDQWRLSQQCNNMTVLTEKRPEACSLSCVGDTLTLY